MKYEAKLTTNYSMFVPHEINRDTLTNGTPKDRRVLASMRKDGFHPYEPIVVYKDRDLQKFVIAYGHNRFSIARYLNIPFWYIESPEPIDPRADKHRNWQVADYVDAEVRAGNEHFLALKHAMSALGVPAARSSVAAILSGDPVKNATSSVNDGTFVVTHQGAEVFGKVLEITDAVHSIGGHARFPFMFENKVLPLLALISMCGSVDVGRMAQSILNHGDLLRKCATRAEYLDVFNTMYNFRKSQRADIVAEVRGVVFSNKPQGYAEKWLKS